MADTIKSTEDSSKHGMIVVNPDGSNIGGGSGTGNGYINDGADSNIKATVKDLTNSNPLAVAITDGSGDQITSFGGGVQYTEGDIDATITGTAALVEGAANALAVLTQPLTDTQLRASDVKITLDGESVPVTNSGITTIAGAVSGTEMQVDVLTMPTVAVTQSGTWDEVGINDSGNSITVDQSTHDNLNANANLQVGNADVTTSNPVPIQPPLSGYLNIAIDQTGNNNAVDVLTMPTTTVTATNLDIRDLTNVDVVTAELSAVDNAVLDTIAAKDFATQTTLAAINAKMVTGTDIGDVTINNASGASAVNIQDGGNTITVDYATTGSGTATGALRVELPTNGTGVIATVGAVTAITNALPAGTNAIGKLAANSGVDIGDVDVTSVIAGTGATNLGKAEDAGHTTGDTGVYNLGVRNDTPNTALTNTDADYASITTDRVGGIRTALYETDFAVLGTNHVKKYYTNAGAVTDGIVWSPAAGKRWYVTDLIINVSAACTVTFEDDKAGGDEAVMKFELAANSGLSHSFATPWFSGEDAADLIVTTSAGNVYITVTGYEI